MSGRLDLNDHDVLIMVDPQNDFCPGGSLAIEEGDEVMPLLNALGRRFDHAVLTQDWHPAGHSSFASAHAGHQPFETVTADYGEQTLWPDHCIQGTPGAAFHAGLDSGLAEMVVRKGFRPSIDSYSAFYENDHDTATGLAGYLRERGFARVFVAGLAFDYCVRWTAEDAVRCGFQAFVVEDACRSVNLGDSVADAYAIFRQCGVELLTSDAILGS